MHLMLFGKWFHTCLTVSHAEVFFAIMLICLLVQLYHTKSVSKWFEFIQKNIAIIRFLRFLKTQITEWSISFSVWIKVIDFSRNLRWQHYMQDCTSFEKAAVVG